MPGPIFWTMGDLVACICRTSYNPVQGWYQVHEGSPDCPVHQSCICTVDLRNGTAYDRESDCPVHQVHRTKVFRSGKLGRDVAKMFWGCTCEVLVVTNTAGTVVEVEMVHVDPQCSGEHPTGLDGRWS